MLEIWVYFNVSTNGKNSGLLLLSLGESAIQISMQDNPERDEKDPEVHSKKPTADSTNCIESEHFSTKAQHFA